MHRNSSQLKKSEVEVKLYGIVAPKWKQFRCLVFPWECNGRWRRYIVLKSVGWMEKCYQIQISCCDKRMCTKMKRKFYGTLERPTILCKRECWAKVQHNLSAAKTRTLTWMCGHSRSNKIKNNCICQKEQVAHNAHWG